MTPERNCTTCLHHSGGSQGECRKRAPERGEDSACLKWPFLMNAQSTVCGDHETTTCESVLDSIRCLLPPGHTGVHAGVRTGFPAVHGGHLAIWTYLMEMLAVPDGRKED